MSRTGKTKADDLNFYALLGVLQSGMWLQADIENYLGHFKLSHGRFSILLSLTESEDHTLIGNELAAMLGVGKPTITKMAGKLRADGLLEFTIDETDSRKKRYFLTKRAEKLLGELVPGYVERLSAMSANLTDGEKETLIGLLSKINFLDQKKTLSRRRGRTPFERSVEIRKRCESGREEDIDRVMAYLNDDVDLPTTKTIDYHLGTVRNPDGIRRIEHYLFHGTQIQRNYCSLFFVRKDEWKIVNKAYSMGLIDYIQAYSK